jgi:plastocyanin
MIWLIKTLRQTRCVIFLVLVFSYCSSNVRPGHALHVIEIREMKFQPAELLVKKGDNIVWINRDIVEHDVTEESGKSWNSSALPRDARWRMVVTGGSNYFWNIHQVMKGRLIVKD